MISPSEPAALPAVELPVVADRRVRIRLAWFAAVALVILIVDQLTKLWIRGALAEGSQIAVLPGWVHLSHVLNHGAAWGMLAGKRFLLIAVAVIVMAVVGSVAREVAGRSKISCLGLALVLGGAIGNLIDRVLYGTVTDFIDLDTPVRWLREFPVFNVADSALTVGVALLIIEFLFLHRPAEKPAS